MVRTIDDEEFGFSVESPLTMRRRSIEGVWKDFRVLFKAVVWVASASKPWSYPVDHRALIGVCAI